MFSTMSQSEVSQKVLDISFCIAVSQMKLLSKRNVTIIKHQESTY